MVKQVLFIISVIITLGVFSYTFLKILSLFKLTKPYPIKNLPKRFAVMFEVAFIQTKIFRRPAIGFVHALVFWGFCVIIIGSIEMIIDGISGIENSLSFLGILYKIIMASGDIFAFIIFISIILFLVRRAFMNIKRFTGIEMTRKSHLDAYIALTMILLLMVSLLGMNTFRCALHPAGMDGMFPVSKIFSGVFMGMAPHNLEILHEINWWAHILLIFIFANMLPYSKHFHVFLSVPNVFLSRLDPLGKLPNMESITKEVKLMMNPETAFAAAPATDAPPSRFGVKDVEDVTWKNYFDSLSCTQCGRCTSSCPANITGKKLSPRKVMMDLRARMKEKGPSLVKNKEFTDAKSLIRDYISMEEIWACTTCNACAKECPININHPTLIVDLRRYLVMEESAAPAGLNSIFTNIENNGAPWQFSPEDRLLWAKEIKTEIPVMAEVFAKGIRPEYLFWVGCAGAFDDRYKKVTRAFIKILTHFNISYAVLGKEETCCGDPARRSGNEMLYQMQALTLIETFKMYEVKKVLTICPHCYNIFKNDYPDLGADFEAIHYSFLLNNLIEEGRLKINPGIFKDKKITYHDPCYLGRANNIYVVPRQVLNAIPSEKTEMKRSKSFALCCGAGGGQMFKEAEKGEKEIFIERTEEAIGTGANIIATSCPFCMVMITDGLKYKNKEEEIFNYDLAELVSVSLNL
ncbi:MAG: (Fe-S)-binding protein [Bacteroidia bacterium]|nr:(Fe-S)-binding protein [Bacteroidia bacterium]